MTSAYEPPINSDYLVARLTVNKNDNGERRFQRGMKITTRTIFEKKLKWKLIRSGKRINPKPDNDTTELYLHLWQTLTPINLWEGLYTVAMDSDYAELYRSVDFEEQDILRFAAVYSPVTGFEPSQTPRRYFTIQELELDKDWFDVQEWQFQQPPKAPSIDFAPPGFDLAFAFQSVTGKLRSHFHFADGAGVDERFKADWKPDDGDKVTLRSGRITSVVKRKDLELYEVVDYQAIGF